MTHLTEEQLEALFDDLRYLELISWDSDPERVYQTLDSAKQAVQQLRIEQKMRQTKDEEKMANQHPSGVAGRVIDEMRAEQEQKYSLLILGESDFEMEDGAWRLWRELSREARAILDELEQQKMWETGDAWERIDSKQAILRTGFERLGLALTDDEPGGCYDPHGLEASGE